MPGSECLPWSCCNRHQNTTLPITTPQSQHPATKAGSSLIGQHGTTHPAAKQQHILPAKTGERSSHNSIATSTSLVHTVKLRAAAKTTTCNVNSATAPQPRSNYPVGCVAQLVTASRLLLLLLHTSSQPARIQQCCSSAQSAALGPRAR